MKKPRKSLWVSAEKKSGQYTVLITGKGWDAASLGRLFDAIQDVGDESSFFTFPVIRELENPELMKVLDERLKAIQDGTAKTIPWEVIKKRLLARVKKSPKKGPPNAR